MINNEFCYIIQDTPSYMIELQLQQYETLNIVSKVTLTK